MDSPQPKIDLTTFFLSIAAAAYMGLRPEQENNKSHKPDLVMAKQNIDLLELMYEKTKGNRSADEDKLIEGLLFELRLKFVEEQKSSQSS